MASLLNHNNFLLLNRDEIRLAKKVEKKGERELKVEREGLPAGHVLPSSTPPSLYPLTLLFQKKSRRPQ